MKKKQGMGRQKTEKKPMENKEKRLMCFSKRRTGLFKNASELSILCSAEVAIVVFSPAGKPFSFGHPSVTVVVDCFLHNAAAAPTSSPMAAEYELKRRYAELIERVEAEWGRREDLAAAEDEVRIEWLGIEELQSYWKALEGLRAEVNRRAQELRMVEEAQIA